MDTCDTYDTDERCKPTSLFVIFPFLFRCHAELLDARDGDEQRVARVDLEESVSHLVESDRLFPLELWKGKGERKKGAECQNSARSARQSHANERQTDLVGFLSVLLIPLLTPLRPEFASVGDVDSLGLSGLLEHLAC